MTSGIRTHFDRELAQLIDLVSEMGSQAQQAVALGLKALLESDVDLAGEVVAGDEGINALRYQIERRCYALLAMEQPVAGDMRAIVSALILASELERIADHGKRIARICQRTCGEVRLIPLNDLSYMGELALQMLARALRTVGTHDAAEARAVSADDDLVDALYKQTFNVALTYMLESPRAINAGTYFIQVAHELERVADRATNVAERVLYTVTGELVDLND